MMKQNKFEGPLTESTYLILLALTEPLHGYGIMREIEAISKGRVRMGPGTLYGGLTALTDKKLIRRVKEKPGGAERRKLYEITERGREALEGEFLRMKQLVKVSGILLKKR